MAPDGAIGYNGAMQERKGPFCCSSVQYEGAEEQWKNDVIDETVRAALGGEVYGSTETDMRPWLREMLGDDMTGVSPTTIVDFRTDTEPTEEQMAAWQKLFRHKSAHWKPLVPQL